MMKIEPIHSGSDGNAYWVSSGETNILLDCGLNIRILQEWAWTHGKQVTDLDGCFITHEHGDHVKGAQHLIDIGVDVYASKGTIEGAGIFLTHEIAHKWQVMVGEFVVMALNVEHDAKEPLAFLLANLDGEKLLYVTDTPKFTYKIPGITHMMIECNHSYEIMAQAVRDGNLPAQHMKRVVKNHMSIETAKLTLERLDRSKLKEVWLLHLSDGNSNAEDFKRQVQELVGVPVYVA